MALDVKVGDEVRVFDVNGRRSGMPEGGWVGTVLKVGRKLFTVDYANAGWTRQGHRGSVFRLEDGSLNDKDFGYHTRVKTTQQAELDLRKHKAVEALRKHGLEVRLTAAPIHLAKLEALVSILDMPNEAMVESYGD